MTITRRGLIRTGSLLGLSVVAPAVRGGATTVRADDSTGPVLVNVFLRGGADGMQIVPPLADGRYFDLRPTLALSPPGEGEGAAIELDGFFGLHPTMEPIKGLYDQGRLAFVHAAGNPSDSHSHFSSQDYMEAGRDGRVGEATGWIGRHLSATDNGNTSTFRALAVGNAVQKSLIGGVQPFGIEDISSFGLTVRRSDPEAVERAMLAMFDRSEDPLDLTTRQAFEAIVVLSGLEVGDDEQGYPQSDFGASLRTLALMIKGGLGVEVASVDSGGWDHHNNLGAELDGRLGDLAAGLAAFTADLGAEMDRVTVVVMTEFGRRAAENASAGTDHGHGGLMMTLGAGVNGGRVYADWPTLEPNALYGPGDLEVTTDYRLVLGELLATRMGSQRLDEVFPDYAMPGFLGVFG